MRFIRSRWGKAAMAALLLTLFLYRPGVYRLRTRISSSIGSALGRKVSIDDVHVEILPRPGFDLDGLVIYDNPAFSAEPMIRAQEVFAAIRIRSLLRGRLEIATMSASEPSVNIVRNSEGRWNLASLIERNAQIPAAPTQKAPSERRPAFPYLEASNARINFKIGQEKKSFTLVDADVALWQDSENSWGARVKAQPVRTDFNLSDTGLLQLDATWQRAASLRQTPMRITAAWQRGQLGQITTLLTGQDRGWRGGVDLVAKLSGTPESLAVETSAAIDGVRRYDILDNRSVRLSTRCAGTYNVTSNSLNDVLCESAVASGTVRLQGRVYGLAASGDHEALNYDLKLAAERVPLAPVVELLHEAKQQLPADLTAAGSVDGEFHAIRTAPEPARFSGVGVASDVRLISASNQDTVVLGKVPLSLVGEIRSRAAITRADTHSKLAALGGEAEPAEAHLQLGPAQLIVNASSPINAGGWISNAGYRFFLRGDAELRTLFHLEQTIGLPAVRPAAEGEAKLDVGVSGKWQGLAAPSAFGTAQLHNVRAETIGFNVPIEIASATVLLAPDVFLVQKLSAQTENTHWSGTVSAPRYCAPACVFQFDLTADQLSTDQLAGWFISHPAKRPWYRILSSTDQRRPTPLLALQAHGTLHLAHFELKKAIATQVATQVTLDRGKISLAGLRARFLQGSQSGDWTIDALSHPPKYHGEGDLRNISLAQVAALMNDSWISGTADGSFNLGASGLSVSDLLADMHGDVHFSMQAGNLTHVELPGEHAPLPVYRFDGNLRVQDGEWDLQTSRLESRDGLYQVTGTASSSKGLDFLFTRGEQSWNLTGTFDKLRVSPARHAEISHAGNLKAQIKP